MQACLRDALHSNTTKFSGRCTQDQAWEGFPKLHFPLYNPIVKNNDNDKNLFIAGSKIGGGNAKLY